MLSKFRSRFLLGLTRNTFLLTLASFFSDVSTEMLYPILPIYLTQYMGVGGSIIGIIEGIATATQNIIQGFSGYVSDKIRNRKKVALFGFCLSAISKPFIGLAGSWLTVLPARVSDRLGSGIRSAPRDALVAASVEEKYKGKAFGLEGLGDNAGAFLGPLITLLLFFYLSIDIHKMFYIAFIPGIIAALMIFLLKEKKAEKAKIITGKKFTSHFPKAYWKFLFVIFIFGLGNSSNLFLILQIQEKGLSLYSTVGIYAAYNLVAALFSYPAGNLSDTLGRKNVLLFAFMIFFITYLGFTFSTQIYQFGILFALYGIFQGAFRAVGKSFATDYVSSDLRASAIGWFSTAVGLSSLVASILAGVLWDQVSHAAVFFVGACTSFIAALLLLFFIPAMKRN